MAEEGGTPLLRLSPPRSLARKRRVFKFPPPPPRDPGAHAEILGAGLAEVRAHFAEAVDQIHSFATDVPYVRLEFAPGQVVADSDLRALGLVPVYRREASVLAAYARDGDLSTFAGQVDSYAQLRKKLAILAKIESVQPWSREDRTGARLRDEVLEDGKTYTVDLLVMPVEGETQNPSAVRSIEKYVTDSAGTIVDRALEPTFSALRVRLGGQSLDDLLEYRDDIALVELPPVAHVAVPEAFSLRVDDVPEVEPPAATASVVCIVDSGILEGHPLLEAAVVRSRSRAFPTGLGPPVPASPVRLAGHGTQVAGLALYGDVAVAAHARRFVPALRLINARILDDDNALHPDRMPFVRQIVEHVKDECRILNLSFGLECSTGFVSVHAAELDALTREFGVLFVVSAGNVRLAERYGGAQPGRPYPDYLLDDEGWKVRAPAEALNVLTVGGITPGTDLHPDHSSVQPFAPKRAPSPFACSGGIRGVVKPEVVEEAGNVAWDSSLKKWIENNPGLRVTTTGHEFAAGRLLTRVDGTSFSTPRVAHLAARLIERYPEASPNLLRALIVQSASLPEGAPPKPERALRLCGFGVPNADRAMFCRPQRVTLYHEGEILPDEVQVFDVPVPVDFAKGIGRKRIIVTIAFDPPVSVVHRDRPAGVHLTWGLARGDVREATLHSAIASEAQRDADDAADPDDKKKSPFMSGDLPKRVQQRGTVQKNIFSWKRGAYGETYRLAITAKAIRPAYLEDPQDYAVVVTLESEDDQVNVFNMVRTRLSAGRVRVRVPAG